jgi:hypothetical protein
MDINIKLNYFNIFDATNSEDLEIARPIAISIGSECKS